MTTSDQFDFTGDTLEQKISLIVPAVQAASEVPTKDGDADTDAFDFVETTEAQESNDIGMEHITIAYEGISLDDAATVDDFSGDTGLDGFDGRLLTARDLLNDDPA